MYGGTCPNVVGCVPSKGLVHHSRERRPEDDPQAFYAASVAKVQEVREFMRVGNYEGLSGLETVTVITGDAVFTGPHTVSVALDGGERMTVSAEDDRLINTGSPRGRPRHPRPARQRIPADQHREDREHRGFAAAPAPSSAGVSSASSSPRSTSGSARV